MSINVNNHLDGLPCFSCLTQTNIQWQWSNCKLIKTYVSFLIYKGQYDMGKYRIVEFLVEPTIFSTTTTCYIMNNNSLFRSKLPFNDIAILVQHATSTITEYPINYFLLWIMWLKYLKLLTYVLVKLLARVLNKKENGCNG